MAKRLVSCPTCRRPVEWCPENPWRPFCSERCRLIDLGEWAAERYRLPAEQTPDGAGENDPPSGAQHPS